MTGVQTCALPICLRVVSKPFAESLLAQAKQRNHSEKQLVYVDKFYDECFPPQEVLDKEAAWKNEFTDEMRKNIQIIGEYYSFHYPNSKLAKNYKNPEWIPDKELYEKVCNSQYAATTIRNYNKPFRFEVGDTIAFRDTQVNRSRYYRDWLNCPLLVLEQLKEAKNNFVPEYKVISVVHMEDQKTVLVKEDHLNVIKNKKV